MCTPLNKNKALSNSQKKKYFFNKREKNFKGKQNQKGDLIGCELKFATE